MPTLILILHYMGQPLKNLNWYGLLKWYGLICLPQISLGLFLNTLFHMILIIFGFIPTTKWLLPESPGPKKQQQRFSILLLLQVGFPDSLLMTKSPWEEHWWNENMKIVIKFDAGVVFCLTSFYYCPLKGVGNEL